MEKIFNDKPFFALKFEVQNCAYDFRVNDGIVYIDYSTPIELTVPANTYVNNDGKNTFSVTLFPTTGAKELEAQGQKCFVKVSLLAESFKEVSDYTTISSIQYSAKPKHIAEDSTLSGTTEPGEYFNGLVDVGPTHVEDVETKYGPGVKITQTVITPKLNMPHWKWLSGEKIADDEDTRKELTSIYQSIWTAMEKRDYRLLESMMGYRNKVSSEATYQSIDDMNIVNYMKKDLESGYELAPLVNKYLYLTVMGNGRLARIYTGFHKNPIMLNRNEQPKSTSYNFVFCKLNGKWEICM